MDTLRSMTLREYLQTIGDEAGSNLLGFHKTRIKSWRLGKRAPKPRDARKIIERTGGKLGWDDIYPEALDEVKA